MDPLFTEEQLNKMSSEDIISLMKTMREHYQKQETMDLCQYFGHKKLNFSPSITYAERIIS